jgi:hypothetical protein
MTLLQVTPLRYFLSRTESFSDVTIAVLLISSVFIALGIALEARNRRISIRIRKAGDRK